RITATGMAPLTATVIRRTTAMAIRRTTATETGIITATTPDVTDERLLAPIEEHGRGKPVRFFSLRLITRPTFVGCSTDCAPLRRHVGDVFRTKRVVVFEDRSDWHVQPCNRTPTRQKRVHARLSTRQKRVYARIQRAMSSLLF